MTNKKKFVRPVYLQMYRITVSIFDEQLTKEEWDGAVTTIRWPDKTTEDVVIHFRKHVMRWREHGVPQLTCSYIPYFETKHRGHEIRVDLHEVEVEYEVVVEEEFTDKE